jgi:hypothetical protein
MNIALKTLLIVSLLSFNVRSPKPLNEQGCWHGDKSVAQDFTFATYCNARFRYCVDYPKELLFPQRESENGDGRIFNDKNGQEVLRVFGRNNSDPDFGNISLKKQFSDDVKDANRNKDTKITYQKLGKSFFVISGTRNSKVFYQKTIVKEDAFAYAILQYDQSEKQIYDKLSERIFESFK